MKFNTSSSKVLHIDPQPGGNAAGTAIVDPSRVLGFGCSDHRLARSSLVDQSTVGNTRLWPNPASLRVGVHALRVVASVYGPKRKSEMTWQGATPMCDGKQDCARSSV
jgi:hypothetical protein